MRRLPLAFTRHALLLLLLSLLLTTARGTSQTPSFNCENAHTPSERLICSDTNLAALENRMVSDYRSVLQQLPADLQVQFRREHLVWFRAYAQICNASMTDEERRACVAVQISQRAAQLEAKLHPDAPPSQTVAANPALLACFKDASIGAFGAIFAGLVLDALGGSGVATSTALTMIGGTALTGCVSGALHQIWK